MYRESNHAQGTQSEDTRCSSQAQPLKHCANCDIDFLWPPIVVQGKTFCCTGCAAGGPCNCDYSQYRSVTISGVIHYHSDSALESARDDLWPSEEEYQR